MLKDITFGQYVVGSSPVHRTDPRLKIIFTVLYIAMLFIATNAAGIAVAMVFTAFLYWLARIPLKLAWKGIKPILPIIVFTALLNLFFMSGGRVLISFWKITIYEQAVWFASILALRIACLIAGSSLLTYTTSPIELTDALERLLSPLKKIKFPVNELAMMMTIALRFIPTLIEETDRIMSAQKSRGASLDTGRLTARVRALVPVLVPLFLSAFRRADDLALAMECRCYTGGEGRTRLKQLRLKRVDFWAALVMTSVFALSVSTNFFFRAVI